MKQSNITYKDTPYFKKNSFGITASDLPSVNTDPDINTTIKENPYKSNVEIEGKELVVKPDLSAIFKAKGERHAKGGMDVYLEPNSFVFSDDKSMALSDRDHKMLELKQGGKANPYKNTPARVLERNVDLKHYNRLVNNLSDPFKDELAKKSSALMLDKYMKIIGNVAYAQESKKGFPDGLPAFAEGTAPVYDTELKNDIMEQKQYAKYGGNIYANEQMQVGGTKKLDNDAFFWFNAPNGQRYKAIFDKGWWYHVYDDIGQKRKPFSSVDQPLLTQQYTGAPMVKSASTPVPAVTTQATRPQGSPSKSNTPKVDSKPGTGNVVWPSYGNSPFRGDIAKVAPIPMMRKPDVTLGSTGNNTAPAADDAIHPEDVTGNAENGVPINWQFNPYQRLSQLYNLSKLAGVKMYPPMKSRFNATYVNTEEVNPEQAISDAKAGYYQQLASINTLNPLFRQAASEQAYGQYLDKVPGIRAGYDSQNVMIKNQRNQMNSQIKNQETLQNVGMDQNYHVQNTVAQQNADNLKTNYKDNYMNNLMRDVETNQALAYNMATLGPKPAYGYDWQSGNFYRNEKNILDAVSDKRSDTLENYLRQIDFSKLSDEQKIQLLGTLVKKDGLKYLRSYKKGGINPYK